MFEKCVRISRKSNILFLYVEEINVKNNRLLRICGILYPPLLYLVVSYLVQMIGIFVLVMSADDILTSLNIQEMQKYVIQIYNQNAMKMTLIAAVITIPICVLLMQLDKRYLNRERRSFKISLWQWVLVAMLGISSSISLNDWIALSGIMIFFNGFEEVAQALYGGSFFIEILAIVIAAPVVEELLFRGLVYNRSRKLFGVKMAIFLSALYFGIYHMNVVQGIYAFLLGLFLAWVYERYQTIFAPILFHASANLISVIGTEWSFSYRTTAAGVIAEVFLSTILMIGTFFLIYKTVRVGYHKSIKF